MKGEAEERQIQYGAKANILTNKNKLGDKERIDVSVTFLL